MLGAKWLTVFVLLLFVSSGFAFLSNYTYRQSFNVSSSASILTNHQYKLVLNSSNINYTSIANNEFAVTYYNGTETQIHAWVESWNEAGNSEVWFLAPKLDTDGETYYLYYTNTSAVDSDWLNGKKVFSFFDDFSAYNSTLWVNGSANLYEINNSAEIIINQGALPGGTAYERFSQIGITANYSGINYSTREVRMRLINGSTASNEAFIGLFANSSSSSYQLRIIGDGNYNLREEFANLNTSTWTQDVNYHILRFDFKDGSGNMEYYIDGTSKAKAVDTTSLGFDKIVLAGSSNAGYASAYDWVRVRNYSADTYTSTNGNEEVSDDRVTINSPTGSVYGKNVTFSFTFDLVSASTANASIYLNGTLNTTVNVTDNVAYLYNMSIEDGLRSLRVQLTSNSTINATTNFMVYEYTLNDTSGVVNPLASQTVNYYVYLSNYSTATPTVSMNISVNGTIYSASLYSSGTNNQTYYASLTLPSNAGTFWVNTTVEFNFGSLSRIETHNEQLTTTAISVTNCSSGIQSIVFNMKDELNESYIGNATFKTIVTYWIGASHFNYSFTFANWDNATLCISPNYSTIYADVEIIISKDNYAQRTNYLVNATLTNVSQNVTTYMISNASSSLIDFEVNNQYNLDYVGAYIKVQRYYTSQTSWIDITTLKTDGLGQANAWLVPYTEAYRFLIYDGNTLVKTIDPMYITTSSYVFTLSGSAGNDYSVFNSIVSECSYNNVTKVLRCTATDPSGLMASSTLKVYENKMFGADIYCTSSATGSAVTNTCDLSGVSGFTNNATYLFYVTVNGNVQILESGMIGNIPATTSYGLSGVFAVFLLFLTMALLGVWNPVASIALGGTALLVGKFAGLIAINEVTLVAILFITLVTVYKLRS